MRHRPRMAAIGVKRIGQQQERGAVDQQPQDQVVILADPQRRVVAAGSQHRPPDQRLEIAERRQVGARRVALQVKIKRQPHRRRQSQALQQRAPLRPLGRAEMNQIVGGDVRACGGRRLNQPREPLRVDQVVAVHDRDPVAARGIQRKIARHRRPAVPGRGDDVDPGIARRDPVRDGDAVVVGRVVGKDQLQPRFGLRKNRLHRRGEIARATIIRHDDGNQRICAVRVVVRMRGLWDHCTDFNQLHASTHPQVDRRLRCSDNPG